MPVFQIFQELRTFQFCIHRYRNTSLRRCLQTQHHDLIRNLHFVPISVDHLVNHIGICRTDGGRLFFVLVLIFVLLVRQLQCVLVNGRQLLHGAGPDHQRKVAKWIFGLQSNQPFQRIVDLLRILIAYGECLFLIAEPSTIGKAAVIVGRDQPGICRGKHDLRGMLIGNDRIFAGGIAQPFRHILHLFPAQPDKGILQFCVVPGLTVAQHIRIMDAKPHKGFPLVHAVDAVLSQFSGGLIPFQHTFPIAAHSVDQILHDAAFLQVQQKGVNCRVGAVALIPVFQLFHIRLVALFRTLCIHIFGIIRSQID